jgi:hypothetical protein
MDYMYDLCMFIRYLVSITQVRKDTQFGIDDWSLWKFIYLFAPSLNRLTDATSLGVKRFCVLNTTINIKDIL